MNILGKDLDIIKKYFYFDFSDKSYKYDMKDEY